MKRKAQGINIQVYGECSIQDKVINTIDASVEAWGTRMVFYDTDGDLLPYNLNLSSATMDAICNWWQEKNKAVVK